MGHLSQEFVRFLQSVFGHWQTWLSGGGIGGFIVIVVGAIEKLLDKGLSKKQYVYLFFISFFLCSCFLSWVDKDEEALAIAESKITEHAADIQLVKTTQNNLGSLQYSCNYQSGVTDTLRKQNGDQQGTINNCQTQALKLLTPETEEHQFYQVQGAGDAHTKWYVYTTNRSIERTNLLLKCQHDITDLDARVMSDPILFYPRWVKTGNHQYVVPIHESWTPTSPIQIEIIFGAEEPQCTVQRGTK